MKIQWEAFNFEMNQFTNEWEELVEPGQEELYQEEQPESLMDHLFDGEDEVKAAISTPWGVFNITDPFAPYKRFQMWIGNTDFNVSVGLVEKISEVRGVEIIKPLSRYSFVIGIGKLFTFDEVRIPIEVIGGVKSSKIHEEIHTLLSSFGDKKYTIYIYPNQKLEYTIETDSNYLSRVEEFYEQKRKNNGLLLSN